MRLTNPMWNGNKKENKYNKIIKNIQTYSRYCENNKNGIWSNWNQLCIYNYVSILNIYNEKWSHALILLAGVVYSLSFHVTHTFLRNQVDD